MPAELTAAERGPAGQGPVNILLVDDEPKNLTALTAVLEGEDRRLILAYSGEEALRHLLHADFAVVLLDVHMTGIDGFETAELIRNRQKTRDTPIIFLTAASRAETFVTRGYSLGAVDYIVKPFDPEALRSKVGVFVDLFRKTEQVKRQAAELTETTTFLNSVLESAPDYAIAALDPDGRFLTWNEGARKVYGYAAEEMIGKRDLAALHPKEDATRSRELLRTAERTGKAEAVIDGLRKNGRTFPASVTLGQRRDAEGRPVGYVLITRDVTDLKRVEAQRAQLIEEQAARSEAEAARDRLQQVLDVLPEAVVLADAEGRVLMSNGTVHEITGRKPAADEDLADVRLAMLCIDGEPYAPDEQPLARIVRRGETVRGEQVLVRHAAKAEPIPVLVNGAPLRDAKGALAGGVMVFQDISPIKDLEDQKDAFLAAASHDLKNPLTSVKARAQMLQRRAARIEGPDGPALLDGLRAIDQTTTRITGMINELLDVARLQMGRPLLLDRESMNMADLVQQVAAEYKPAAERHEIRVDIESPDSVGEWDRARLERVLSNLVSNAIKFSPDGGRITLRVRDERRGDVPWVAIEVEDQGVGIPADDLPHVFERFFRGSNVTGTIEGTGLGLAGASQIIEQHGGSLTAESREGQGSTFTVLLPLRADEELTGALRRERSPAVAAS